MRRFPTPAHLASWAGMCPGNDESAGKRRSGKTRKGSPWLRSTLIEAARAARRTKGTYLSAQCHRLAARRGTKRAAVAVGHTILVIVYHLLSNGKVYHDLGERYFDGCDRHAVERRLVARLEGLGYRVALDPAAWGRSIFTAQHTLPSWSTRGGSDRKCTERQGAMSTSAPRPGCRPRRRRRAGRPPPAPGPHSRPSGRPHPGATGRPCPSGRCGSR
jgi:hypothetical protein